MSYHCHREAMDGENVQQANDLLGPYVRIANGFEGTGVFRQPPTSAKQLFLWKDV